MTNLHDLLIAGRMLGGNDSPELITKTVTANGTYSAASDNADGYSAVTVNCSAGTVAEGVLPMTFSTTKNHLFDYRIHGNTVSAGAPNIFNSSFKNGAYNTANGIYNSSFNKYLCTNTKVPVKANTAYLISPDMTAALSSVSVIFYTAGEVYISSSSGTLPICTFTTPNNCAYVNINLETNVSGVQPSVVNEVTVCEMAGTNLFDSSAVTANYTFDQSGNLQTQYSQGWYATDYMPIFAGKRYDLSGGAQTSLAYDVFYDAQKNVLSTFTAVPSKSFMPSEDGYIRCSIQSPSTFSVAECNPKPNVSQGVGEFAELDNYAAFKLPITCSSNGSVLTSNISVGSSKLESGDYVDFGSQQRVNSDSTAESVNALPIKTNIGENSMNTNAAIKPSNVEIEYIAGGVRHDIHDIR